MSDFVTDQMCDALARLQTVKGFDFPRATHEALSGPSLLRPCRSKAAAEILEGRLLALELYNRRQNETARARMSESGVAA